MRRYVAGGLVSTDKAGRVLLAEVQRVASRKLQHGCQAADLNDRRQASRVLARVRWVLRQSHDSSKPAAAFGAGMRGEAWRKLPDVPALEHVLAAVSRREILFLTARFLCEVSREDTLNPARWIEVTKCEMHEAAKILGGRQAGAIPGIGIRFDDTGLSQQEFESLDLALKKTKLSRRLLGVSGSLRVPKLRKRGYTLARLCGWSRQLCHYWQRQTEPTWPAFRKLCREFVTHGVTPQRVVSNEGDAWNVEEYLEGEATKVVAKSRSTTSV